MFDETSRYAPLPTRSLTMADGRDVRYAARRLLPSASAMQVVGHVRVTDGDRVDLVAARSLGDPLQYWRVCDGNQVMHPEELVADPGATIRISLPLA